ncbi:phenylacetate--CoA ligase family protein [Aliivibrio logei]|uniref:phenylacetate--CoA ligase family protein n=1 Tax=Aliivibrio logei TaxID=688 RepID=UPI0035C8DB30
MKNINTYIYSRIDILEEAIKEAWKRKFYQEHWGYKSLDDVINIVRSHKYHTLPVTRKHDLRDNWDNIMCFDGAIDVVSSSGTTGRPVDIPVHKEEENVRVEAIERWLHALGVNTGDKVLILLSMNDLFTLGVLSWQAVKKRNACAIRCSVNRVDRILQIIEHLKPKYVIGNAGPMIRLAEEAGDRWPGHDLLPKKALLGASAVFDQDLNPTPALKKLKELWGFDDYLNTYGSSEIGAVSDECSYHQGLHIHTDHQMIELIDLKNGLPLENNNQPGELVITGLNLPRGFIPIRYATGDIVAWIKHESCPCGQITPRMGPIIGRVDHQLKISGQTVFPDLLLSLADESTGVMRSAVQVKSEKYGEDEVTLLLVIDDNFNKKEVKNNVISRLDKNLSISPKVNVISSINLLTLEKKASKNTNQVKITRIFDFRKGI